MSASSEYIKALRDKRRAAGLCIWCAAGLQEGDGTRCIECTEKGRSSSKAYQATDRGRAAGRERQARIREKDRAAYNAGFRETYLNAKINGICVECSAPCSDESVRCEKHRATSNERSKNYRRTKRAGRKAA